MLTHLCIRNLLLLKSCDIPFAPGLNVLTGETGAGKSILLDALGLVLGERSDAGLVRAGEANASVTAEFDVANDRAIKALLVELELETDGALILRRTLSADGKSRAFINDAAVSAGALKRLAELLVARHGQHDSRGLMDSKTHRDLLDAFGDYPPLTDAVRTAFAAWKQAVIACEQLREQAALATREEHWLRQVVEELSVLSPEPGEEERLTEKRKRASEIRQASAALREALSLLTESGGAALQLRQVSKLLSKTSALEPSVFTHLETAEQSVEEVSVALERALSAADMDPMEMEAAEDRIHALRGAARKFNVAVALLPDLLAESRAKLNTLTNLEAETARAQTALADAEREYRARAGALYAAREQTGEQLAKAVTKELKPLKMGATQLRVTQAELPPQSWGERGMHQVSFEVATNSGMPFGPLNKVASGGELSRLLLAMKAVLHEGGAATAIFDEIDTGTGGAVAEAIGVRLRALSQNGQVIVVTHAPQVAALASHHLFIKKSGGKSVVTQVEVLDAPARREELARMLSGATISNEARQAAGKLLESA